MDPRAKCKCCPKDYSSSRNGTGHLRRNIEKCMLAHEKEITTMVPRRVNYDVAVWRYCHPTIDKIGDTTESNKLEHSQTPKKGQINKYLEAQFDIVEDDEEFDLLLWRKTYSYRYLVLSHLAHDVLVSPLSTVYSEQTFSISGRIIEPRKSCLSLDMVKDWENAKKRL
ncbi:hypothetical protein Ddye_028896 [Dipteronia dyeriana]|uniref:HAT C-terminal dimerisation domain-containing protein n=1 Tax=Dipteronia dyeriana TaxID=168575 RepID=A0AAD9TDE8_9ROSI|nr:hypothetical protein Ddye_028896 [Dipteronia dyeriana]